MNDTLIIDSSYRPIGYCDWTAAIKLYYENVAEIVKEDAEKEIHSQYVTMKIPRVIRIKNYVAKKRQNETVALTARNIAIRDNKQCQYCGISLSWDEQTLDHVIPKSRGGKNTWENLVLSCGKCNRLKADFLLEEIGMKLLRQPFKPKSDLMYTSIGSVRPEWADFSRKQ